MKAACWVGERKVSVEEVPDPQLLNARERIVRDQAVAEAKHG